MLKLQLSGKMFYGNLVVYIIFKMNFIWWYMEICNFLVF